MNPVAELAAPADEPSAADARISVRGPRRLGDLRDWLVAAWAIWWAWTYARTALLHRFPHLMDWVQRPW